jgi:hypothetical protein
LAALGGESGPLECRSSPALSQWGRLSG